MNIMKEAHKMTKEIKSQYPEVDYKFQLGLCLSYLSENKGEVKMEMVELKGSEKQVKWAEEIRKEAIEKILSSNAKHKEQVAEGLAKLDSAAAIISNKERYLDEEYAESCSRRIEKRLNK